MGPALRLADYEFAPGACEAPGDAVPPGGRLKLWEIGGGFHCSVIGTCLATADLTALARRLRLALPIDATDYEIHGCFVQHATRDSQVARALQRLLDHRYEGALRQVARQPDGGALSALWDDFKASGRIAGGYWALLSHRHVPQALRARAFGEVHMMSHLQGAAVRDHAARLDQLERETAELRDRLARATRSTQEAQAGLEARDRRIAMLSERLSAAEAATTRSDCRRPPTGLARKLDKRERSLAAARTRARNLEAEVGRLTRDLALLRRGREPAVADMPATETRVAGREAPPLPSRLPGGACRLLYVGGRPALLPHLRDDAERRQASLIHHDGGKEETLQRIDDLVESADAVLCPVDCVSHSPACASSSCASAVPYRSCR